MRSLFRFLARNYFFLLFLALESVCLVLIVNYNNYQKVQFLNSSNHLTAGIYESYHAVVNFFKLQKINAELAEDNARLKNQLQAYLTADTARVSDYMTSDSIQYQFIPAKVVNNSVNKQYNYITLNKGRKHGIEPEMGIIGPDGIVGIITYVSDNYSTGPTLLNKRWRVSAKIKANNNFGSLAWDGMDNHHASLNEIPFHVEMLVGDTIVTSGFSSVFPEGMLIGYIDYFTHESGANFYDIDVRLSTNFMTLTHVQVVKNKQLDEIINLQENNRDE
ncbi:rod shape-determining protein MreC [Gaoshiqia sp. Z1-71]|uniref:rod shape-determining protein MreC n=1 Tax=Gaoshiqia hydrogeniformans TaxID=3290090 RepID=UPI003BF7E059